MKYNNFFRNSYAPLLILMAAILCLAPGCQDDDGPIDPMDDDVAGFIYTTTNGEGTNQVVRFSRHEDGSISDETVYSTNSMGGANRSVGGDAHGDFDSQGAVQIIGDYLLCVNAGGNTISVFSLNRDNGNLNLKSNTDSEGTRPVSIAVTPMKGNSSNYWVAVGNQWNNPNVQKDLPNVQRFPNDAFHMADLDAAHPSDPERNVHLFRFNAANGRLRSVRQLDTYVRKYGGPVCVEFSPDGSKLAMVTWGIAHFGTSDPSLAEQQPSRAYIYDFNNASGMVSNGRFHEESGIAGSIGFNWAPENNSVLLVSNFNTTVAKSDHSVTVLEDSGSSITKTANFATGTGGDLDEACWTIISPTDDKLYVSSFGGNLITPFALDGSGRISNPLPVEVRGGFAPPGDSKDMWINPDNQYLYNIGAFQSFSMNIFDLEADGISYREQITLQETSAGVADVGRYNFLGLAGFDK